MDFYSPSRGNFQQQRSLCSSFLTAGSSVAVTKMSRRCFKRLQFSAMPIVSRSCSMVEAIAAPSGDPDSTSDTMVHGAAHLDSCAGKRCPAKAYLAHEHISVSIMRALPSNQVLSKITVKEGNRRPSRTHARKHGTTGDRNHAQPRSQSITGLCGPCSVKH